MVPLEEAEQRLLIDEKSSILFDLLHLALLENKCDIVSLLLLHDINLTKFLDGERLKQFYNNEVVSMNHSYIDHLIWKFYLVIF